MSNNEPYCDDCGPDYSKGEECKCSMIAAEMDPAREPDVIERLLSIAKKALEVLDNIHEEDEGPMAMPTALAEDLRTAIYDLEDVYTFLPYEMVLAIRMEQDVALFNAKTLREADEESGPLAIDPDLATKHSIKSMEEFTEKMAKRMEAGIGNILKTSPFEPGDKRGLTIEEVIRRYRPNVIVKCPHSEDCFSCEMDNNAHCVHSHEHRVGTECLFGCGLYDDKPGCQVVEHANEEEIS